MQLPADSDALPKAVERVQYPWLHEQELHATVSHEQEAVVRIYTNPI